MCACTEPVRTGIGAVCVVYGRPKWLITMLNQTRSLQKNALIFYFWHPMLVRPAMERRFCLKAKNGLGSFAPSALPHYKFPDRLVGGSDSAFVSTAAELKFNRNPTIYPPT